MKNTLPADPTQINIYNDAEISYWTKQLQVNEAQLRAAIFIAGKKVEDVKNYLHQKRYNTNPVKKDPS